MPVYVFADGKYNILAGNKIVKDGKLLEMKSTDSMIVNGTAYRLGFNTPAAVLPEDTTIRHINGEEPSGTKWYISTTGSGTKDGTSWENAASYTDTRNIINNGSDGDNVFFAEGTYYADLKMTLVHKVNAYGGFDSDAPAWETRDGFAHPTVFDGGFNCMLCDGITFTDAVEAAIAPDFKNGALVNGSFGVGNSDFHTDDTVTAIFSNVKITNAQIIGRPRVNLTIQEASVNKLTLKSSDGSASSVLNCIDAMIVDSVGLPCENVSGCSIRGGEIRLNGTTTNSDFLDAEINFRGCNAFECTFNYCQFGYSSPGGDNILQNCNIFNATEGFGLLNINAKNLVLINSNIELGKLQVENSQIINNNLCCRFDFSAKNSFVCNTDFREMHGCSGFNTLFVNCHFLNYGNTDMYCSIVANCSESVCFLHLKSTVCFNSPCSVLFAENDNYVFANATSSLISGQIYLGNDNSLSKFANTGFYPAVGVQNAGDCPSPVDDPEGFDVYIKMFGDWHPASDSILVGKGMYASGYPADLDGVIRPDPPTIGAYEPKIME